jgi:hypothetical protein
VGYSFDLGQAADKSRWLHQPVGYPAQAFPMRPSYMAGVTEMLRQTDLHNCTHNTWGFAGYSQGAIVASIILQRVLTGDLQQYKSTFIGGVTFGNPMREKGHTCPGGTDPGGSGIVLPNLVNTPDTVWDFASGSKMAGSTATAPAAVSTSRGWWYPLRTTSRRPSSPRWSANCST